MIQPRFGARLLGFRRCVSGCSDAEALSGQNTSTVKMATSEPVRERDKGQLEKKKTTEARGEIVATPPLCPATLLHSLSSPDTASAIVAFRGHGGVSARVEPG